MMDIQNSLATVSFETHLITLHAAMKDAEGAFSEACGLKPNDQKRQSALDGAHMQAEHMREAAAIAITGLYDLGRYRRAHFWCAKFDFDWGGDGATEDPEGWVRKEDDLSLERDGNIYDSSIRGERTGRNEVNW